MSSSSMDEEVSDLGRYRLIAELAHGGMGDVYLGVLRGPAGFSKLTVIKQLRPALADDEQFLTMFMEEARLAARLNHGNVVQTTEVGSHRGKYFLAMEYLEGQSLQRIRTRIAKEGPVPLGPHLRILVDALRGLHYAHELADIDGTPLGIVHRDATPHNIFVTYDGVVKLVDFGIAKALDSSLETRTGELKGKVAYMPPEQAAGVKVDRRADIFAFGVMIWEAAVGKRLWHGKPEIAIVTALMAGTIPRARNVNPEVPEAIDRICRRALATEPDDRYPTAAQLADDLERFLADTGDRSTGRDIARLVTGAFADDRKEMKTIIDRQLLMLRTQPEGTRIYMTKLDLAPTGSGVNRISGSTLDQGEASSKTGGGTASTARPAAPSRTPFYIAGALILFACIAGGFAVVSAMRSNAPTELAQGSTAPHTHLVVTVEPSSAQLTIDDAPLGHNPFDGAFARDGLAHRVHAEAQGYLPRTEIAIFDKDEVRISLALSKMPELPASLATMIKPPTQRPTTKPPPSPSTATTATNSGGKKPPRPIDNNPFGNE